MDGFTYINVNEAKNKYFTIKLKRILPFRKI